MSLVTPPLETRARPPSAAAPRALAWLAIVAVLVGLRSWVVEPLSVPSDSMAPTLLPGDHVVVEKVSSPGSWKRGDLLAFTAPGGTLMVKRLVGVAGDRVALRDGVLVVNGRRPAEPYVDQRDVDGVYYGPVRVPPGRLLLLGDSRGDSVDSRRFGPVPTTAVLGRVLARVWPPDRMRASWSGGVR